MAGQVNFNKPTGGTRNRVEEISVSAESSFKKHDEILHEIQEQNLERTISNELTSNPNQNLPADDGILILKNLSNPKEEFCIDLSDSSAPVVKRKSMISLGEFFEETILPKEEMYGIEDHGVTLDFEC
ncbi:Hypothetical predicted protein [Paramuricea clavata]|uniref:Uncharacterized protein n=1 Tax=Paramuricea clavata TaxID=317549 RepID=A0A7D9K3H5_PARCT|nr:Hypothetical predicted protein [Paramuricea clavata]